MIMIAAGVSSLKRQLTISVCLANEAPYSASSFEGNPQLLTHTAIFDIVNLSDTAKRHCEERSDVAISLGTHYKTLCK